MEQNHRELHPTRGNTAELRDSVEQTRPQCVSTEHPTRGNTAELRDSVEQTRPQCVSTEHPTRGNTAELRDSVEQTRPQCVSTEQRDATTVLNGTPRLRDVSEAVCT